MAGSFTLQLDRFAAKANGNMDLVVRKVCFDIFARVIMRTPVDTGRARGNWMAGVGTMPIGETGAIDKGGAATAEAIQGVSLSAKAGDIVYLTNTLPYILKLEQGWSSQAPSGMISVTLREYPGVVEDAAREVNP